MVSAAVCDSGQVPRRMCSTECLGIAQMTGWVCFFPWELRVSLKSVVFCVASPHKSGEIILYQPFTLIDLKGTLKYCCGGQRIGQRIAFHVHFKPFLERKVEGASTNLKPLGPDVLGKICTSRKET